MNGMGSDDSSQRIDANYGLSKHCFAYVGDPSNPATWRLPYRRVDGRADSERLPTAIETLLSRGQTQDVGVPEEAIPNVLIRLAEAAAELGCLPHQSRSCAPVYRRLVGMMEEFDLLDNCLSSAGITD